MYNNSEGWLEFCFKFLSVYVLGGIASIMGIFINMAANVLIAVPFWLLWTVFKIGAKYFYFLPDLYQNIPLWNCIGIFLCVGMVKLLFAHNSATVNTK